MRGHCLHGCQRDCSRSSQHWPDQRARQHPPHGQLVALHGAPRTRQHAQQLLRADYGSRGQGFESLRAHSRAQVTARRPCRRRETRSAGRVGPCSTSRRGTHTARRRLLRPVAELRDLLVEVGAVRLTALGSRRGDRPHGRCAARSVGRLLVPEPHARRPRDPWTTPRAGARAAPRCSTSPIERAT
ncbi:MAG: hypothetical protein JWN17_260 [Frankiales bacterium]|nr:hypothetical protein [Frankiales bacterium]